jgi:glycerol-3-phosphate acyltransferase PlsY
MYILYLTIPLSFLIGSVPFGVLLTRSKGIDLRKTGSGNIGATNVLRSTGKVPALLTLIGDGAKGALSVLICRYAYHHIDPSSGIAGYGAEFWEGLAGTSAVLGHMFSVFLSLRGGKGVATGFGFMSVYSPNAALISLLIWISVAAIIRYSSLAAMAAVSALPFILLLKHDSMTKIAFSIVLAALIVFKHKSNIRNLLDGTESRIGKNRS